MPYFPNTKIYSCLLKAEPPLNGIFKENFARSLKNGGMIRYIRTALMPVAQLLGGSGVKISSRILSLERTEFSLGLFCCCLVLCVCCLPFFVWGFFVCFVCFREIYPVQLNYVPKIPRCRCLFFQMLTWLARLLVSNEGF